MIRKQDVRDLYPLSPMQEGMLFRWLYDRESTAYFEQLSFRVDEALDCSAFDAACRELFRRHDVLRTVFAHENASRPLQIVLKEAPPALRFEDLRHLTAGEQKRHLEEWKTADRLAGFDLIATPPVRLALFQLGEACQEVVWSHHHILMDGWCLAVVHAELVALYDAFTAGRPSTLPPPRPFGAYIRWLEAQDAAAAKRFWSEALAGYDELTPLPRRAGFETGLYRLAEHDLALDDAAVLLLRRRAAGARVTQSTVLHALWGILLGKTNDARDAIFGSVVANRPEEIPGVESIVGLFINTVPVRVTWDGDMTFRALLARLHEQFVHRRSHEFLSLAEIQAASPLRDELFDHIMLVQNYPIEHQLATGSGSGLRAGAADLFEHTHYAFTVSAILGSGVRLRFSYDANRFAAEDIAALAERFHHLLDAFLDDLDAPIASVPLAEPPPVGPADEVPEEHTLLQLFDDAVRGHRGRVAVSFQERSLTYEQLDRLANGIAHDLVTRFGIEPDDRVALLLPRSELTIAAMLGVAKAGAAYVAIDPAFPPERIRYIVEDSGSKAAIAAGAQTGIPTLDVRAIAASASPPPVRIRPDSLLYVAYTSGSTGRPKGVMIEHRNVAAFAGTLRGVFGLDKSDRILALTTYTFDISVLEMLCSLTEGLHVIVPADDVASDPRLILDEIAARGVTVLQVTPSRLDTLIDAGGWEPLARLRVLLVGGEAMPPDLFEKLRGLAATRAFNVYGPTETTIWSTALRIGGGPLTAGGALPGESILVLSRDGHLMPPGIAGEVCIAGSGLGRGYHGRDDLTHEKYISHPLLPGARLYRTGDLGRMHRGGEIEILGRRDDQVKIRGFRVETGEVEAALRECPGVRHAAVIVRNHDLVAYVAGDDLSSAAVRAAAGRLLPAYMVPPRIVVMEHIPLLPSGKADRKALPAPEDSSSGTEFVEPRDAVERAVAAIWAAVLGRENIGVFDDFFAIGGHSLKAMQVLGRLHRDLRVDLRMRDLFTASTVAALAALVRSKAPAALEPLQPLPPSSSYEVSHAQRRMWVLDRLSADPAQYVMAAALRLEGELDEAALRQAFDALAARHESLRTTFPLINDEPRQVIAAPFAFPLEIAGVADEAEARDAAERAVAARFDLERGPLARAWLFRVTPHSHVLVFAAHHIVCDGESLRVLVRDLSRLYAGSPLKRLPVQYRDYAAWQNHLLTGGTGEVDGRYWRSKLDGGTEPLDLPLDRPRPPLSDPRGSVLTFPFTRSQSTGLAHLARERGVSVFMVAVALVKTLLHRYTGAEDIVVGTPISGRVHPDLGDQAGIFLNTLALRDALRGQASFTEVLDSVRSTVLEAFDHQLYPFDRLVEELGVRRDASRTPLFDVLVTMAGDEPEQLQLGHVQVLPFALEQRLTRFDLAFTFAGMGGGMLAVNIEFRTALFDRERIERMMTHLSTLISAVIADSGRPIADLDLISDTESALLRTFNDTRRDVAEATLVELFDAQAARTPDRVAVADGAQAFTYAELREASERIAAHLDVEADERVALLMDRSAGAIAGIIGILRAGGAYVPLDPGDPDARLADLIAQSDCRAVLAGSGQAALASGLTAVPIIDAGALPPAHLMPRTLSPDQLAYVIFTSGTTGQPKGVMIEHRSVVNLVHGLWDEIYSRYAGPQNVALVGSLTFDASVQQIFAALLGGHSLHIVDGTTKRDGHLLFRFFRERGIAITDGTPSLLALLLESGAPSTGSPVLRHLIIGGETLTRDVITKLRATLNVAITNVYGPTECTVDATFHHVTEGLAAGAVSIGRPLPNVRVYVCDGNLRPMPIGIAGEICIAGAGLARGYFADASQTARRFVVFNGERLYRTGDYGRWCVDGTLEFFGRRDQQVKIRGHRIELGEIEHHLRALDGVRAAVVDAREGADGTKELVAYVVASEQFDESALRAALSRAVPAFMLPSRVIPIDTVPMTPHGKVDRRALPDPRMLRAAPAEEVTGTTEEALLRIWREVLGIDSIGLRDNFFEMGGHSLKAVRAASRVREELGAGISIADFFARPTIAEIAELVRAQAKQLPEAFVPAPAAPHYPLSSAQRRLWVLSQMNAAAYNIAVAFDIEGTLDVAALESAFTDLIARHESLRARFLLIGGELRQVIDDAAPFKLGRSEDMLSVPFDLANGPLIRASLVIRRDLRHRLSLALHHIVADAWSLDLVLRELGTSYAARAAGRPNPLPPLYLQAKDFAWSETSAALDNARAYWMRKLGGELPLLDLATDFRRPPVKSWRGRTLSCDLSGDVVDALERLAGEARVSLYAVLVALVKVLLHRYSGQEDIIIGSAAAGRGRVELEEQIGFYVDTLALRDDVRGDDSFVTLLRRVSNTIDEAHGHRYPFDRLVEELQPRHDPARAPLFDVMLVFGRNEPIAVELPGLRVSPASVASTVSKFDLTFCFERNAAGLRAAIEYDTDVFSAGRIERMLDHIAVLAASVVRRGPDATVGTLDVMSAAENALVTRFNTAAACEIPETTIFEQFALQAAATPTRLAVVSGDESWTYAELRRSSARVAQFLRGPKVRLQPGEAVVVNADRSPRAIAALLGILEAGGIYVPVDSKCPPLRLEEILGQTGCRVVISDPGSPVPVPSSVAGAPFDRTSPEILLIDGVEPHPLEPGLAYIIFTSGSTGTPKGVMLEDRGFVNMALRQIETFGITADDRVLQFASPSFDASMSEIFMALFAGAALVRASRETIADGTRFIDFLDRAAVTVATLPPPFLHALGKPPLPSLRVMITAGEAPVAGDAGHYATRLRYFNAYGPTESSVCATIHEVLVAAEPIPIGRPLANTSIHVLDAALQPVPIGVPGEICIGGAGLARGYLGDAEQTARRFVVSDGRRLYRSGDLGWWNADGRLVYAGRLDDQIKILGQRIEPGEVASVLESCPGIAAAFVTVRAGQLVAYLEGPCTESIGEELRGRLPAAMIPAHLVWVDALPRTVSGKIDKNALPLPAGEGERAAGEHPPRNHVEAELVAVWQRVLRIPRVGIHDHFFDLGGDSIKLLQVTAELQRRGLRVEIADIYQYPTIAAVAPRVEAFTSDAEQGPVAGIARLSATQTWFARTWKGNVNHFNQSVLLQARRHLDEKAVRAALNAVAMHHDALRTRFDLAAMQQELVTAPPDELLDVVDVAGDEAMEREGNRLQRSLDVAAGRVFAAALLRGREHDFLLLVAHHLVVDAVSWRIVLEDLSAALQGLPLPRKTHSFKEWAEQHHVALMSESLRGEQAYWNDVAAAAPEELPSNERSETRIELSAVDSGALLARTRHGRADAVFLTALARALRRCGDSVPLVVLEGHGREEIVENLDVSRTVGWFTSIYPFPIPDGNSDDVARALATVPNRGVGYQILTALGDAPPHSLSGATVFNFIGDVDVAGDDAFFEPLTASLGDAIDPYAPSLHVTDVLARVAGGIVSAVISGQPAKTRSLAAAFAEELRDAAHDGVLTSDARTPIARVRPYAARRAAAVPLLLNGERARKLFAMPPLFGYGAAFRALAAHIADAAVYAFDFVEDEARIEQYARGIIAHGGPSPALLGYSGGGNLAFEVAKELERRGHPATDLILFDAPLRRQPITMSDSEIREMMESNLVYFRKRMEDDPDYGALVADARMKDVMLHKMESFIRYLNGLVNRGTVGAAVHLIRSAQQWAEPEEWDEWAARTMAGLRRYQGFGDHADMTDDRNVAANAAIVTRILAAQAVPELAVALDVVL